MLTLRRTGSFALLLFALTACGKEPAAPAKTPDPPVVRDVTVGPVASAVVEDVAEVMGTVKSRTTVTLSSKIMGRITALHVREGSLVEAGQVLVELEERDIAAQVRRAEAGLREADASLPEVARTIAAAEAARAAAEAQRDLAGSTLARYQRLLDRKSIAPQEYDQVAAKFKAANADVARAVAEGQAIQARRQQALARIDVAKAELANAQVLLDYGKIVAPWSGIVTTKFMEVGGLATPGSPILTLEDNRRYWLELAVPDAQAAGIRAGQSLSLAVEAAGLATSARVGEIIPLADPATRTTQVRLDLPSSPRLRSGLFGRARLPVGSRKIIQVTQTAIVERGQLQGVYVVSQDGIARFRLVRTGETQGGATEVLSGLTPGEQVILSGAERVADGARIEGK